MTGIILQVKGLENEDFMLQFYIERDRALTFAKKDLIKAYVDDSLKCYALIDADAVGRGHLMCRAEIVDKEPCWKNNQRPVVISGYTGYDIGACGGAGRTLSCGSYAVSFERVEDIPVVGKFGIANGLKAFDELTAADLESLKDIQKGAKKFSVKPGDTIVVALPANSGMTATKDNGWGEKIPFSTTVMGANGIPMTFNDEEFLVYGEFCIVHGNYKIYIE